MTKAIIDNKTETDLKTNWNLTPLFSGDQDPKIEQTQQEARRACFVFVGKWKERNDYLSEPAVLKEALEDFEKWLTNHSYNSKVCYYFHLRTELEQNNTELKALYNKAKELSIQIQNDIQFFTLKLAQVPPHVQRKFLIAPELDYYRHFLEKLFAEAKYLLSEPEEKIINLHSETAYLNWVKMVEALLAKEKVSGRSFPEILASLNSPNQKIRDRSFAAANAILAKHADVAEAEFNSVLGYKKVTDDLRQSPRPDFLRHLSDDIDSEVVDSLIIAVSQQFELAHRFYALKAKALGRKKIKYYEKTVPVGRVNQKYSYSQAVNLVGQVLDRLDSELKEIFDSFIKNGQIDVYPRVGRADGAFCTHMREADPTYILLNHTDQLRDVLTLAHETGHGLNNELIKKKSGEIYFDTPLSTAEVASTFVEDFVLEEIGRQSGHRQKFSLIMAKLDDDVASIFRQVAAYRFEQELHNNYRQKGYLSKEEIGELFLKNMQAYTGPAMEYPAGTANWWIYWSHFRNFFYVYSYGSGLLISKALQARVRQEPGFISAVKKFLSAGTSAAPAEIFRQLGLDIKNPAFWQSGLNEISELLTEAENLFEQQTN